MAHRVYTKIHRADPKTIEALGKMGVATVHEAQDRTGLLGRYMRPIYVGAQAWGPAVTVSCAPGDNSMIHIAIRYCHPGDVLVVEPTSFCDDGYFGDLMGTSCKAHGIKALFVNAGVRDVMDLARMEFPVWCKVPSAQGTVKDSPGSVNIPIVCAGQKVSPGDIVIGDYDGVVIVNRLAAETVLIAAEERLRKEAARRDFLAQGGYAAEKDGLIEKFRSLGVKFIEDEPFQG